MIARLVLFTLGPGTREVAENMANQFAPQLKAQKGFKEYTFAADWDAGEYMTVVIFETRADADAAVATLEPKLQQALQGIAQGPPTLKILEVFDPER